MIRVNPSHKEPLYRQLVSAISEKVALNQLENGVQLPSVREMALELGINPNTVARAYRELEAEGVVVSQRGKGVYVNAPSRPDWIDGDSSSASDLDDALDRLLEIARRRGISVESLTAELRRRSAAHQPGE